MSLSCHQNLRRSERLSTREISLSEWSSLEGRDINWDFQVGEETINHESVMSSRNGNHQLGRLEGIQMSECGTGLLVSHCRRLREISDEWDEKANVRKAMAMSVLSSIRQISSMELLMNCFFCQSIIVFLSNSFH
jgi:hypothetical protein